jgi:hypothetical protein
MYKAKIWLVVDLANEHNIRPEILRGRFKACKETAIYEGIEIPVVTDFELRPVQSFGAGSLSVNVLSKKWLSKPLVKSKKMIIYGIRPTDLRPAITGIKCDSLGGDGGEITLYEVNDD